MSPESPRLDLTSLRDALASLQRALTRWLGTDAQDEELRDACIQRFEYTFELSWKMLQRRLELDLPDARSLDAMSFRELMRSGGERGGRSVTWMPGWYSVTSATSRRTPTTRPRLLTWRPSCLLLPSMRARCLPNCRHGKQQMVLVQRLLAQRLPHVRVLAFGSRVAGWPFGRGPKPYSDLDLALWGLTKDDDRALAHLRADLEESDLPWRVDLCDALDLPVALRQLVEGKGLALAKALTQRQPEPLATTP